jgi:hypothetical protein
LLSKNTKIKIYRTVILPLVLDGCETCSVTLREEHRLRVFVNRVLRKIFGPKRDEVTGQWRRLHVFLTKYYSGDVTRRMKWVGHVACVRDRRGVDRVLVETPDGRRPLEDGHRWEGNIKMDLQEVGWGDMDWIALAQDRDR